MLDLQYYESLIGMQGMTAINLPANEQRQAPQVRLSNELGHPQDW